jgi:hypothetical protein
VPGKQSWISLITYCVLATLGAALAFALIVAGGSVALASRQQSDDQASAELVPHSAELQTFRGMVTDSHCNARHLRNSGLGPAECARLCLRRGASYVLVDGERRYRLEGDPQLLEHLVGTRVSVHGTRQGETISVRSAGPVF